MNQVTYTRSIRVAKARLLRFFPRGVLSAIRLVAVLLLATGATGVVVGITIGYTLVGCSIGLLCLYIWVVWDVSEIPAHVSPQADGSIRLDEILAADIVSVIGVEMSPYDIWMKIADHWEVNFILLRYQLDRNVIESTLSKQPEASPGLWQVCLQLVGQMPISEVTAGVIATAMIVSNKQNVVYLESKALSEEDIIAGLRWEESLIKRELEPNKKRLFGGIGRDWASGFTPILDTYGHNISLDIQNGNQSFSGVSRGHVIEQMETNLSRANRGSVALVGDVGVGKTAMVYALAEKMIRGETDKNLLYKQIVEINPTIITASVTEASKVEAIFEQIFSNTIRAGNIILFFDEAQLFFSKETGTVDISKILLPILQQSNVKCIISLNSGDWHKLSSSNPGLVQSFSKVEVEPADQNQTITVLQDIAIAFEGQYRRAITFAALQASYKLSERYLHTKAQPARSIDLLEDSCNYPVNGLITAASVEQAIEIQTNVKVSEGSVEEKDKLLHLEEHIHEHMINQEQAVVSVANALRRTRAGVRNSNRPVGSFLFLGPTGVGKTELAKSLARVYFGGEDMIIRLDMSEYQTPDDIHRFLAAASSDNSGSHLLEAITQKPFSVVLFDEIEKANPDILNLLLQLLDEGALTDESGKKVSFKEAIIICTSNAGADEIRSRIDTGQRIEDFASEFTDMIINSHQFKPELINRFDELILFRPLTKQELLLVAYILIKGVNKELASQKITVALTEAAYLRLVDVGYDPRLGARPMRRAVQRLVENTIAKQILSQNLKKGGRITLDVGDLQE